MLLLFVYQIVQFLMRHILLSGLLTVLLRLLAETFVTNQHWLVQLDIVFAVKVGASAHRTALNQRVRFIEGFGTVLTSRRTNAPHLISSVDQSVLPKNVHPVFFEKKHL